jgi:hypothetical protein
MQADTKKNASRENRVNMISPTTVVLVASGAKKIRVCVEMTAACLTGRIASIWSSLFRVPFFFVDTLMDGHHVRRDNSLRRQIFSYG